MLKLYKNYHGKKYLTVLMLILFTFISLMDSFLVSYDSDLIAQAKSKITVDFNVTTKSSMTAKQFDAKFKGGAFKGQGAFLIKQAEKYGINAGFMAGIMGHETGWGTSDMAKEIYNPGGLSCLGPNDKGKTWTCVMRKRYWKKFSNPEDAITEKAAYLQRKFIKNGKKTIGSIQKQYCPDGDGCSAWVSGVISAMESLKEGGGSGTIDATTDAGESTKQDAVSVSPFAEYTSHIDKQHVNKKVNNDTKVVSYLGGKYITTISKYLMLVSRIIGALLFGYMSFLWLFVLLARTKFPPAYAFVTKMTNGLIDPFDDLNKLFKYSIYGFIFSVVAVSGLLPKVFALIYKLISYLLSFVLYEL